MAHFEAFQKYVLIKHLISEEYHSTRSFQVQSKEPKWPCSREFKMILLYSSNITVYKMIGTSDANVFFFQYRLNTGYMHLAGFIYFACTEYYIKKAKYFLFSL